MAAATPAPGAADGDDRSAATTARTATEAVKYDAHVVEVGQMVPELLDAGVLVLFGSLAPPELREIAVVHYGQELIGDGLVPGDILELDGRRRTVTAVGTAANANFAELGHIVIKATGAAETELPGEVYVEQDTLAVPPVGARLRVLGVAPPPAASHVMSPTLHTAQDAPAQDAHEHTSRQRRGPWAFLSDWLNWRRRDAPSE